MQTVEAGSQESKDSYDDRLPYPFLFYTPNRYSEEGDHAESIAFYGEIFNSNDVPGKTRAYMNKRSGYV